MNPIHDRVNALKAVLRQAITEQVRSHLGPLTAAGHQAIAAASEKLGNDLAQVLWADGKSHDVACGIEEKAREQGFADDPVERTEARVFVQPDP